MKTLQETMSGPPESDYFWKWSPKQGLNHLWADFSGQVLQVM